MNSRFGLKASILALLALSLCASGYAATSYNSVVWAADATADGMGTGTLNGSNTVAYTSAAVSNAGITFDTATFPPSWNASPATNGGGTLTYSSTLAGVLGTLGAPTNQTITFSAAITNPVLLVDFASTGTVITIPGTLTLLSSNNCSLAVNTITCAPAPRTASDGFAVRIMGTFGPGTPLLFTYADGGGANTIGFSIASLPAPTFAKVFSPSTVGTGGTTSLVFTITNPNATALSGGHFADNLPAGLTFTPGNIFPSGGCIGGLDASTATQIAVSGLGVAASGTCTLTATGIVVSGPPGSRLNTSGAFGSNEADNSAPATATLVVVAPPTISKTFADAVIQLQGPNNPTSLTFTISNPAGNASLTAIAFTDTLPSGLLVGTPNGLTGSCGGGTITAVAGSNSISLTGATLAAGASCTFSVNVLATTVGAKTNTTSTITANAGAIAVVGAPATATTTVVATNAYQLNYLPAQVGGGIAGGYIDITNAGGLGADGFGPLSGTTGRICVNVYVFTADEQESECCSCLVTPNALVRLTAADLIGNPGNGVTPTLGVVVKLLATIPGTTTATAGTNTQTTFTGSACNAALPFTAANLAPGMEALATKFHTNSTTTPASVSLTETRFSSESLSPTELTKLTNLCQFLGGNQSGAGLCKACSLGGLGAGRR